MKKNDRENPLLNLLFNIALPSVILMKFSGESQLGSVWGFLVALFFPISYGIFDLVKRKKWNFFSILGLTSVVLTGGIGLLHLSPEVLAIKEAGIPFTIGLVIFFAEKRFGFAEKILLNDEVFDTKTIKSALKEKKTEKILEKKVRLASFFLAGSFFFSAILNFFLVKLIVRSPSGSPEFAAEVGKMTAMSYPIIVIPMMVVMAGILFFLFRAIRETTGLKFEELMRDS